MYDNNSDTGTLTRSDSPSIDGHHRTSDNSVSVVGGNNMAASGDVTAADGGGVTTAGKKVHFSLSASGAVFEARNSGSEVQTMFCLVVTRLSNCIANIHTNILK